MNAPDPEGGAEALYAHIRGRIAFENMVAAALIAAVAGGAAIFILKAATALLGAGFGLGALGRALFDAVSFSFAAFLAGFLGSVVVGLPLFVFLEERKLRAPWPFYIAALAVGLAVLFLIGRGASLFELETAIMLVPAPVAAYLFTRRLAALRTIVPPRRETGNVHYLQ